MSETAHRDRIIVAAVATGATHAKAAELAGCSVSTVRRRLAIPDVRQALNEERQHLAETIADALTGAAVATVERLNSVIANGNDRDAATAGRILLAEGRAWRDTAWTVQRIEHLEDELTARRKAS